MSAPPKYRHLDPPTGVRKSIRADSLVSGVSLLLVLTVGQRFVGLGRQIITCRYLDPMELGRWNLAFSVLVLAAPLIVIGIPGSFGRYVQYYEHRNQLRAFLRRTTIATVAFTLLGIATICLGAEPAAWLMMRDTSQAGMMRLLGAALASVVLFNFLVELLTALRQIRAVSYMQMANGLLFAAATVFLFCCHWRAAEAIVTSYAIACLATSLIAYWPLKTVWQEMEIHSEPCQSRSMWAKMLPFAGWIWLANLLSNLFAAADRYMIVHFSPGNSADAAAIVGQYHSSRVFPELMTAIAVLLGSVMLPYISQNWERGEKALLSTRLNGCLKFFAVSMTIGGAVVLWIAPALFQYGLGGKYADGLSVLPWSIIGCIWAGQFYIAQNYHLCVEKAGRNSVALIIGLAGNVALNMIMLPRFGLLGAVFATAAANALALAIVGISSIRLGLHLETGTMIATLLPATLALGVIPAVLVVTLVVTWGLATGRFCSKAQLAEVRTKIAHRISWITPLLRLSPEITP